MSDNRHIVRHFKTTITQGTDCATGQQVIEAIDPVHIHIAFYQQFRCCPTPRFMPVAIADGDGESQSRLLHCQLCTLDAILGGLVVFRAGDHGDAPPTAINQMSNRGSTGGHIVTDHRTIIGISRRRVRIHHGQPAHRVMSYRLAGIRLTAQHQQAIHTPCRHLVDVQPFQLRIAPRIGEQHRVIRRPQRVLRPREQWQRKSTVEIGRDQTNQPRSETGSRRDPLLISQFRSRFDYKSTRMGR